ncbi:MAG: tRNA (guanosine(37)-N1)-methyltransferase TrmD, partial [Candidatus Electrothrix sp. AUS3]|nr:tRNA (guanosine(37)-N1)-methyltransferase TrmD [Candidatus Electrothrix gigas]
MDEQYSIGDLVISGGELASLVMSDSILRHIPGVLGHKESAQMDSFAEGCSGLLEHDLYTRPPEFLGYKVPEVLMS